MVEDVEGVGARRVNAHQLYREWCDMRTAMELCRQGSFVYHVVWLRFCEIEGMLCERPLSTPEDWAAKVLLALDADTPHAIEELLAASRAILGVEE